MSQQFFFIPHGASYQNHTIPSHSPFMLVVVAVAVAAPPVVVIGGDFSSMSSYPPPPPPLAPALLPWLPPSFAAIRNARRHHHLLLLPYRYLDCSLPVAWSCFLPWTHCQRSVPTSITRDYLVTPTPLIILSPIHLCNASPHRAILILCPIPDYHPSLTKMTDLLAPRLSCKAPVHNRAVKIIGQA